MKNVSKVRLSLRKFLIAAMAVGPLAVLPSPVWAVLPTNASFQVTNGTATAVEFSSNIVNINASDRAVLVWGAGNFVIDAADTWNFSVGAGGAVLNKVGYTTIGLPGAVDDAIINGTLRSDGRVFIMANGNITVSATATINTTGGLVLTTLEDSEAAFRTTGNLLNTGSSLGNITLADTLDVTGDLEATTGQFASNQVGGGTVLGNLVLRSVTANQGIQLATGSALTVTNSNLTVITNNGAITQDNNILAANTSRTVSLSTGSTGTSGIVLSNTSNDFGRVALTTNGLATVVDANALVLAGSTIGGALDIDAGGNISTAGAVVVGGNADYSTSSGSVTVGNNSSVGGNLTGSASGTNNFTYSGVGNLTTLAISGGNVSLTSNAAVRINGAITSGNNTTVTGTTINQTTGGITTAQALTYNATSGNVILGAISADRISVTTNNSAITQAAGTGITTTNTTTAINSFNAGSAAVTLNSSTNELAFGPRLNVTASTANIVTGNGVNIGTSNITGGNYTLNTNEANTNVRIGGTTIASAPTINVAGILNITTSGTGTITDNPYSAINAQGGLDLSSGTGDITLTAASVNAPLAPLVSYGRVNASTAGNVTIEETNTLNLGDVSAGNLTARSINGDIVDSGEIVISGSTTFRVGAGANVVIDGEDNQFSVVNFIGGANNTFVSSSSVTIGNNTAVAGNLTVTTTDDANVTLESPAVSGMLTVNADGTIAIGGSDATVITGNLMLSSNDTGASSITQSQALRVTGNTTIMSAGNVVLGGSNDFSTLIFTSTGGDATIADINNLALWGNVGGVLTATSGATVGSPVVSAYTMMLGNLSVGGLALTASNGSGVSGDGPSGAISQIAGTSIGSIGNVGFNTINAAVTLNNTGNSFGGVSVNAGNATVNITEDATLRLVNLTTTGNANLTSRFGSIVDSGSATVIGGNVLTLNAANGSVTLNPAAGVNSQFTSNTFVVNAPNGAVQLRSNAASVALGNVTGISLTVNHTGGTNLTQSGRAQIFGTTNVSTGGNIILSNTTNNFGRVLLTTTGAAKSITVTEAGTLNLGSVSMPASSTGNFTATSAGGDIIDSGLLGVRIGGISGSSGTGLVTLNAASGNIILDDPTTDFFTSGGVTFTGNTVTFATLNSIVLGTNNTTATANTLNVTSATGSISGAVGSNLVVTGDATFQTGNGNITLTQSANRFGAIRFAGNNINITQANDINLITGSTAIGNVEFNSGSYITIDNRGGIVTIGGQAVLIAQGAITLPRLLQIAGTLTVKSDSTKDLSALSLIGDLAGKTPVNLGTGAYLPPAP